MTSDEKPRGFRFAWPPTQNPKNKAWRRYLRNYVKLSYSWLHSHKHEMNGGCPKCMAVEATIDGPEGGAFVHMHCFYCNRTFLG
jgi:hypothetical protein